MIDLCAVVVLVCLQVKLAVVPINHELHLVFVAAKPLDIGDELLFDYDDKSSKAEFLKTCPMCVLMDNPPVISHKHPMSVARNV